MFVIAGETSSFSRSFAFERYEQRDVAVLRRGRISSLGRRIRAWNVVARERGLGDIPESARVFDSA